MLKQHNINKYSPLNFYYNLLLFLNIIFLKHKYSFGLDSEYTIKCF